MFFIVKQVTFSRFLYSNQGASGRLQNNLKGALVAYKKHPGSFDSQQKCTKGAFGRVSKSWNKGISVGSH